MANKPLGHHPLGLDAFSATVTRFYLINIDDSVPRKIKFKYNIFKIQGDPETLLPTAGQLSAPPITDLLNIDIEETCFVQMWLLSDKLDWYWRSQDAITTAHHADTLYKRLEYFVSGNWVSDPGVDAKCQAIRFGALLRPGPQGPRDPFNMNVVLDWGMDGVLPITIDPDIQNPKV